jgi:lysophospholipid acyltransferase (LPLAT)-like uncharacterized protein
MAKPRRTIYYFFLHTIGIPLAYVVIRLLVLTLRIRFTNQHILDTLLAEKKGIIYAFWHGDLVLTAAVGTIVNRRRRIFIMTSLSRDGELLARLLRLFKFGIVRGSTSRAAVQGLHQMKKRLDEGYCAAVAVDGPRGPRHQVKPGIALLAKASSCPILPFAFTMSRAIRLRSWDQCEIPLPFSRCELIFGTPVRLVPNTDHETLHQVCRELETALLKLKGTQKPA